MYAIHPTKLSDNKVCIKLRVAGESNNCYEVSMAFDDSCGVMSDCARGDLRVYIVELQDGEFSPYHDITDEVFPGQSIVVASVENLYYAKMWCKNH